MYINENIVMIRITYVHKKNIPCSLEQYYTFVKRTPGSNIMAKFTVYLIFVSRMHGTTQYKGCKGPVTQAKRKIAYGSRTNPDFCAIYARGVLGGCVWRVICNLQSEPFKTCNRVKLAQKVWICSRSIRNPCVWACVTGLKLIERLMLVFQSVFYIWYICNQICQSKSYSYE